MSFTLDNIGASILNIPGHRNCICYQNYLGPIRYWYVLRDFAIKAFDINEIPSGRFNKATFWKKISHAVFKERVLQVLLAGSTGQAVTYAAIKQRYSGIIPNFNVR